MTDLEAALATHFGHAAFRSGQRDVVAAVLRGEDVLAVMPTGSGKSLGFQLPAVLLDGVTLVVSPLISLMKDQVDELTRRGIAAAAIHSAVGPDQRRAALAALRQGALKLLYVAPERFAFEHFVSWLGQVAVARFVVDEAHCISEWGHDFRPDYRRLGEAVKACRRADGRAGRPPVAAFTATATPEVRQDIVALLGLEQAGVFVAGFDRPNIELYVQPVGGDADKRRWLRRLVGDGRALVYASTRKSAEQAAGWLSIEGVAAEAYHAGLADAERARIQDAFASGRARVVCATNAFGMGIDRPDIDTVVHVEVPGSIEAYYQEIGRAGRDGRPAVATLLWNYADVKTREYLIDHRGDDGDPGRRTTPLDPGQVARRREVEHRKLRRMVAYASTAACLRATILRYFGDAGVREPCDACGSCLSRTALDGSQLVRLRKILAAVARSGERYGRRRVAAMLAGETDGLPESLVRLSTTGLLRDVGRAELERWIDAAVGAGLLRPSDDEFRVLGLTRLGRDVMAGRVTDVRLAVEERRARPAGSSPRPRRGKRVAVALGGEATASSGRGNARAIVALKAWRREEAARRGVPPYVVLHDRTLEAIAAVAPTSLDQLASVHGIGPSRLDTYGAAILDLLTSVHEDR